MPKPKNAAAEQLLGYIERIERLNDDKAEIADDIRQVFAEAKATGFDTGVMRRVIAIRKKAAGQYAEEQAVLDTYLHGLGMIEQTDMFDPAREIETRGEKGKS